VKPQKHEKPRSVHARGGRKPSATSLHAFRTRKECALAELRELEVKAKRGELLDADAVAREWADVLRQVRAGVLTVVSRVRVRLPHFSAADAAVLDDELRQALAALAEQDCETSHDTATARTTRSP
jgi:phage terminase Nu1 subunit (DNA packaging protein)